MRTSVVDEGLQLKQPCQHSALWGSRVPRPATTWRRQVQLWWNSRNDEAPAERTPFAYGRYLVLLLAFAVLVLSSSSAFAGRRQQLTSRQKVSPELVQYLTTPSWTKVNLVVQFHARPGSKQVRYIQANGGTVRNQYKTLHVASITLPAAYIPYIAQREEVVYISSDRPVRMSLDRAAKTVAADIGWSYGLKGKGVAIAVIDSGIWNHADLNEYGSTTSRVVYSESFVPGDRTTNDLYGHGTHVAGIAGGNGQSSGDAYRSEYRGVAPEVNIVNLRVLDANGQGTDSAVIAAIDRAIELKSKYNIRVINLSLGRPVYESYVNDPLCQAVEAAWKAGIVVVVAAGNSGRDNSLGTHGYATVAAPGNDPYVITVGATEMGNTSHRSDDVIASYSAKGPTMLDHVVKPDLVAPGNRVVSLADPSGTLSAKNPKLDVYPCDPVTGKCNSRVGAAEYFRLSGTSMAAPIVAGAAALMVQNDPNLTPDLVKARLMKTAWKSFPTFSTAKDASGKSYKHQADIFTYGAGYLDVQAALNSTDIGEGAALSPTATYDSATGFVSLSFPAGHSVMWGSSGSDSSGSDSSGSGSSGSGSSGPGSSGSAGYSVIWGSSMLWGSSVVWGAAIADSKANILWGNSVMWGSTLETGFSVIWGSSVIWGAATNTAFSPGDEGDCPVDDDACGLDSTTLVTGAGLE